MRVCMCSIPVGPPRAIFFLLVGSVLDLFIHLPLLSHGPVRIRLRVFELHSLSRHDAWLEDTSPQNIEVVRLICPDTVHGLETPSRGISKLSGFFSLNTFVVLPIPRLAVDPTALDGAVLYILWLVLTRRAFGSGPSRDH